MVSHYINNKIVLIIFPLHSSHLTQPSDVGVFGPLKKCMATEIEPLLRASIACVQKMEWLGAFIKVHERAFREKNVLGGFIGIGIYLFNTQKVLD